MKKSFKILLTVLLVFALTVSAVCVGAVASEEETPALQITDCTLSFDDSVYIMYALPVSTAAGADVDILYFTEAEESVDGYNLANAKYRESHIGTQTVPGRGSCYIYKNRHLNAKNMTDVVYARAYASVDGVEYYSNLVKYSILEYSYNTLGRIPAENPTASQLKLKELLETMLAYGAASQKYFNYNTENLATDEYFKITVSGGHLEDMSAKGMFKAGETVTLTANGEDMNYFVWYNSSGEEVHIGETYEAVVNGKSESYTVKAHRVVTVEAVAPTCTETGLTEGVRCDICGTVFSEQTVVDALGHIEVADGAVAPDCTNTGLTEGSHCSRCEEILVEQTVVDALGHIEVTDVAVAPDCTNTGLTEGSHCSRCEEILVEQTVVDALGHIEVTDVAVAPDCTNTGLTEGSHCSRCEEILVEQAVVDALGHIEATDGAVAPDCTNTGLTEGSHCSRCEEILVEQTVVDALGHNYVEYECTRCGDALYSTGLEFTLNDDGETYTLTGLGSCADEDVKIPPTYKGLPVTAIGAQVFNDNDTVIRVAISENIDNIAFYAFSNTAIEEIYFNSVRMSDKTSDFRGFEDAGSNGDGIRVIIGKDVERIPAYLFDAAYNNQPKIVSVEFEEGSVCETIGAYAFSDNDHIIEVTLPDSLVTIEDNAFVYCENLTTVSFGSGLKVIGENAFGYCTALKNFALPESLEIIESYAFSGCTAITAVNIPDSVRVINDGVFQYCSGLTSVTIGQGVDEIGFSVFYGCEALTSVKFTDTVYWYGTNYRADLVDKMNGTRIAVTDSAKNAEVCKSGIAWYKK